MSPLRSTAIRFGAALAVGLAGAGLAGGRALARDIVTSNATAPCAVLESMASSSDAQILDPTRTRLTEGAPHEPVFCGGWVSVERGWVVLKHRFGYEIHLGPHSFAQFLDGQDAILLFRGQLYAEAGGGMGELRVLTPNARAAVSRGAIVALFDPDEESTQLIGVDGVARLGNRFDPRAETEVKAGQGSTLDFKLLRVMPSVPKLASIASLKAKLDELNVSVRETEHVFAVIRNREKEAFVAAEKASQTQTQDQPERSLVHRRTKAGRKLASEGPSPVTSFDTQSYLARQAVGGSSEGLKLLKLHRHRRAKAHAGAEDPDALLIRKQQSEENAEKHRLIEELSKIKSD